MNSVIDLELPMKVASEDGEDYVLKAWQPSFRDIEALWSRYENYRIMFSDLVVGDKAYFFQVMLAPGTVVLEVQHAGEAVGVMYITDLRPQLSADAHYFFWDRKTAGRQRVILTALDWAMRQFSLHRVNITVPFFAYSALHRIYKMRIRIEGRKREALLSRGKWIDMLYFAVLRDELDEEALQNGYLACNDRELGWFDLLKNDEELMSHIVNRRAP